MARKATGQVIERPHRAKRPRGTGSLRPRPDAAGRETWYGEWWSGGRRVKRALGLKREPGSRDGLTRSQAEAELRRRMREERPGPAVAERLTLAEAGERYLRHLEGLGRKPSTVQDYRIILRRLARFFAGRTLDAVEPEDVEAFIAYARREQLAPNTVRNHLNVLGAVLGHAVKRGWAASNPVARVDRPNGGGRDDDFRYLDEPELEALLRHAADDHLGELDRTLWLTAAMTGLRRGELLALRWRDVDWPAGLVRVRRSVQRGGGIGQPKSRRASRATPMADRVAAELERHFQRSRWQHDDHLVFAHPRTGRVYDPAKVYKRYKAALERAGLRPFRFHDLRHTFGVRMAAAGAPMRLLQAWMGHASVTTTEIYADFAPDPLQGGEWARRAFDTAAPPATAAAARGAVRGAELSETQST